MTLKEKQKQEAIVRLTALVDQQGLNPKTVKDFKQGRLYYSYLNSGILGCIDTITYDPTYEKLAKELENERNAIVYHAIETISEKYGTMLSLLYVSQYEDDWETERLEAGNIFAYVYNFDLEHGELGYIFLSSDNGGLYRADIHKISSMSLPDGTEIRINPNRGK